MMAGRPPVGEPFWASDAGDVAVYLGKCEDVLPGLPGDSVDAIVTDPPAAVGFMGREWDSDRGGRDAWVAWLTGCLEAAARVLKPGGHLLVWSLPRTSGWTQWAIEDAGLEVRDCIVHLFGQGMPKGHDVSKAIDRIADAEREVIGAGQWAGRESAADLGVMNDDAWQAGAPRVITAPATPEAARWAGWNVALKPGQEMWWLARKPLSEGTVAANVLRYGTGALNVAGCRVGTARDVPASNSSRETASVYGKFSAGGGPDNLNPDMGRWPTNLVFTHSAACEPAGTRQVRGSRVGPSAPTPDDRSAYGSGLNGERPTRGIGDADGLETVEAWCCAGDCPVGELDRQSGGIHGAGSARVAIREADAAGMWGLPGDGQRYGDSGGASRFYPVFRYQAKAPTSERPRLEDGSAHETVKPLGLIRWLARLITPPGGTVLDMFAGSGPVGEACVIEGFRCVLIDQDPKSASLMVKRFSKLIQPVLFAGEA